MVRITKKLLVAAAAVLLISTTMLSAADLSGREVMDKVYNRPSGDFMAAELDMTITNSRGSERNRTISQYRADYGDVEKKIMFFTAPSDVRNTSFLNWSYRDGRDDDQWMYLPALKRVKRISSGSTNDSFMGSDFTYDDLGERHPSEDTHTLLRMETVEGQGCYVVESIPGEKSEIGKTISWIVDGEWIGLKKEYYDTRGKLVKQLTINDSEKIDGLWVITDMTMEDLQKRSSTRIEMNDVDFSGEYDDSLFTERQMQRGLPR